MHEKGIRQDGIQVPDLGAVTQVTGSFDAGGLRFGIVVSRFNESLTRALVTNAVQCLEKHGADAGCIKVVWVPGGYEVPSVIHELAATAAFDALIGLGVVIQGETPHADMINRQVTQSLADISRQFHVPVIHEVVAACNLEQAEARCTSGEKSRGWYAALAAIETARVYGQLKGHTDG